MVYKKFIKRNGKVYGPYTYHSRRVNGKVISEYHGPNKNKIKLFSIIIGTIFLISLLVFLGFKLVGNITGNVALDVETNYLLNEPLEGTIQLSLKEGEFLPANSLLILEAPSKSYEFVISEIISNDKIEGNYFLENSNIEGYGEGYGITGKRRIYPEVSFVLEVSSNSNGGLQNNSGSSSDNDDSSLGNNESEDSNEINDSESGLIEEMDINEENLEVLDDESAESSGLEISEEVDKVEENLSNDQVKDSEGENNLPITGNVISNSERKGFISKIIGYLFFRITGNVVSEISEVSGKVSESDFTYQLDSGQTVSLKSGSVYSGEENIADSNINLEVIGNLAVVKSNYFTEEEGFGEDYLGDKTLNLNIDVSNLNVISENGTWTFKLVYQDSEIISNQLEFEVEGVAVISNTTELEEINKTIEFSVLELTSEEIGILTEHFGNVSVEIVKAEEVNGRLVIRMEIGKYWLQNTYDDLSNINDYIENERIRWLKDLAETLSQQEKSPQKRDDLIQTYAI